MWTANLKTIEKVNGSIKAVIEFVNGPTVVAKEYFFSGKPNFKAVALDEINQLTTLYTVADNTPMGNIDLTPDVIPTPPAPVPPTPQELALAQFQQDYNKWQKVRKAIDVGILTGNEQPVINLQNKVKSEFIPAYLDYL